MILSPLIFFFFLIFTQTKKMLGFADSAINKNEADFSRDSQDV